MVRVSVMAWSSSLMHSGIRAFGGTELPSMVRFIFTSHQVLSQAVVKFAGEFPAFLVLQLQQAHTERSQGRFGLLPRAQLGVQQAIVEEKQRQGHDEGSGQDVGCNAEQPVGPRPARIQKELFMVLHRLQQRVGLG